MKSICIVILCPAILLIMSSSSSALNWSLESLVHSMTNIETKMEDIFLKTNSRQKRAAAVSDPMLQDYFVDIEISFPNSSFLDHLRLFASTLMTPMELNISGSIINITSINVTTVCSVIDNTVSCSCESGYTWPNGICTANPQCASSSPNCTCHNTFPIQGCEVGDNSAAIERHMTCKMDEEYVDTLKDPSSEKYRSYKNSLEIGFRVGYSTLQGFKSATVTGFRKGSIIADYVLIAAPATDAEIEAANKQIISSLNTTFKFPSNPFQTTINDRTDFTAVPLIIFQSDTVTLRCQTISNSTSIFWSLNDKTINLDGMKYRGETKSENGISLSTLTITNITLADSGIYTCTLDDDKYVYVQNKTITVQSLETQSTATVVCNNNTVKMFSCCTNGDIGTLQVNCTTDAKLGISANSSESRCVVYSLQASNAQCITDSSGKVTHNYNCECSTGNGAKVTTPVAVTFIRAANLSINKKLIEVSKNFPFNLACSSDVNVFDSITWVLRTAVSATDIATNYYSNILTASLANSTLSATATKSWNGTISCVFLQNNITVNESAVIQVVDLPTKDEINVQPKEMNRQCDPGIQIEECCCYEEPGNYTVTFGAASRAGILQSDSKCYCANYTKNICSVDSETVTEYCKFKNRLNNEVQSNNILLKFFKGKAACNDTIAGEGRDSDISVVPCEKDPKEASKVGTKTFVCNKTNWEEIKDDNYCIFAQIAERFQALQDLIQSPNPQVELPVYLQNLSETVTQGKENISSSAADIRQLVGILESISNLTTSVGEASMTSFIATVDIVVKNNATWQGMGEAVRARDSTRLMKSADNFAEKLVITNDSIRIPGENVILQGIRTSPVNNIYKEGFNFNNSKRLNGNVNIPTQIVNSLPAGTTIVTIGYATFIDILPADGDKSLNGLVMSTVVSNQSSSTFQIVMEFQKNNLLLTKPLCVFWSYTLNNETGGWDDKGCAAQETAENVTCTCEHLTSFSILMSSSDQKGFSPEQKQILDYITYIGVGISMASLVVCIIIEAIVWKSVTKNKTSYMRHVCLVNIAVSLLIADIWFIIGANMEKYMSSASKTTPTTNACDAVTFFTHLFYLSLFFWMLTMGLILFYRLVYVFHDMSRTSMLAVSFCLGYGCPLLISVITVAVTRPGNNYRVGTSCWLNITPTRAFLAFVIPALTIVAVNVVILVVVIVKLLRPSVGDKPSKEEKSILVKIAKSVAILSPLLGLTWGFGIATMVSDNLGIHGTFAALNAFQGLFILVFATLWDTKIRESLLSHFSLSRWASQQTKSTSLGSSRPAIPKPDLKMPQFSKPSFNPFAKRGKYSFSSTFNSSSGSSAEYYSVLK